MDYARIAKIHDEIFSTPPNSKERMEKLEKLSEADRERLFDFDMGLYSGRTKKPKNYEQEENGTMTYEQFVKKSESDEKGGNARTITICYEIPGVIPAVPGEMASREKRTAKATQ